jgi:hypothetical protein
MPEIVSAVLALAVLFALAVLKDVESSERIHVIREALVRRGQAFRRFDERVRRLADRIG